MYNIKFFNDSDLNKKITGSQELKYFEYYYNKIVQLNNKSIEKFYEYIGSLFDLIESIIVLQGNLNKEIKDEEIEIYRKNFIDKLVQEIASLDIVQKERHLTESVNNVIEKLSSDIDIKSTIEPKETDKKDKKNIIKKNITKYELRGDNPESSIIDINIKLNFDNHTITIDDLRKRNSGAKNQSLIEFKCNNNYYLDNIKEKFNNANSKNDIKNILGNLLLLLLQLNNNTEININTVDDVLNIMLCQKNNEFCTVDILKESIDSKSQYIVYMIDRNNISSKSKELKKIKATKNTSEQYKAQSIGGQQTFFKSALSKFLPSIKKPQKKITDHQKNIAIAPKAKEEETQLSVFTYLDSNINVKQELAIIQKQGMSLSQAQHVLHNYSNFVCNEATSNENDILFKPINLSNLKDTKDKDELEYLNNILLLLIVENIQNILKKTNNLNFTDKYKNEIRATFIETNIIGQEAEEEAVEVESNAISSITNSKKADEAKSDAICFIPNSKNRKKANEVEGNAISSIPDSKNRKKANEVRRDAICDIPDSKKAEEVKSNAICDIPDSKKAEKVKSNAMNFDYNHFR